MSEYIVSARKYRPLTFDTVVGQSGLTTTLKNAIASSKLAHAYLFCGPRGVGKTTSARIFAKTINCLNPTPEGDACGECESCRAFDEHRSFNIHELDAASNNSVEDIRTLIDEIQIPPQIGRYKVFIIDEVHMLSQAAFNAFLKTLEEPPSHVIFILATTEKHKILPTILSRCQTYDFKRITLNDIIAHLRHVAQQENYTTDDEALAVIAEKADGGMRDALSIFDQVAAFTQGQITYDKVIAHLGVLNSQYYFTLVDHIINKDIPQIMLLLNEVLSKGFDAGLFINGLGSHIRNVMMCRDASTRSLLNCSDKMRDKYAEQAQRVNTRFIYQALKLCNQCDINYRTSHNKRLLVEITLIQIAQSDEDPVAGRPRDILSQIFEREEQVASHAHATAPNIDTLITQKTNFEPSLPKANLGTSISISLSQKTKPIEQTEERRETASTPAEAPTTLLAWNNKSLLSMWLQYADQLPENDSIMAQRMRAITPQITNEGIFTISINNENLVTEWLKIKSGIESHLSLKTGRNDISMNISVTQQEQFNEMSPKEWFTDMIHRNPNFEKLSKSFQLNLA